MKRITTLLLLLCMTLGTASAASRALYERWKDGTSYPEVDLLLTETSQPALTEWLTEVQTADNGDDLNDYSARITCWVVPPVDGTYTFWLVSDDGGRLWLNTEGADPAGAEEIARVDSWVGYDGWQTNRTNDDGTVNDERANQKSAPIFLEGGKAYYLRAAHQEGSGGDYVRVAWSSPDAGFAEPQDGVADSATIIATPYISDKAPAWEAINVWPEDGATDIADDVISLEWSMSDIFPVPGPISQFKVYLTTNEQEVIDPNETTPQTLLTTVDGDTFTADTPALENDTTYYWRVDALVDDANVSASAVWSFTTILRAPMITLQPQDTYVGENCDGILTVAAENREISAGSPITYQWYDAATDQAIAGLNSEAAVVVTEGDYYVLVSNELGSARSDTVTFARRIKGAELVGEDIGAPSMAGSATKLSDGEYSFTGVGNDIWGTADQFHYLYTPLFGDGEIVARVASHSGANEWRKAGVMIRETLDAGSKNVMAVVAGNATEGSAGGEGMSWQVRPVADADSYSSNGWAGFPGLPHWVKLVRKDNTFTAYHSTDGLAWEMMPGNADAPNPMTMDDFAENVYVGVGVTSHDGAATSTAVVDNVQITAISWKPVNPAYDPGFTAEGWIDPEADLTVSWEPAEFGPCGDVTYDVYFGDDPLNLVFVDNVDSTSALISESLMDWNTEYFWRVDTRYNGEVETGDVWSFQAIKRVPVIAVQPDGLKVVVAGQDVQASVEAVSLNAVGDVSYEWIYQPTGTTVASGMAQVIEVGVLSTRYLCPLTLTDVQIADEGAYVCEVTNDDGTTASDAMWVVTKRLVLDYGFESIDNGVIADRSLGVAFDGTLVAWGEDATSVDYGDLQPGVVGNALYLIGSADPNTAYVDTGASARELGIEGANPRTLSIWVKAYDMARSGVYTVGQYNASMQLFGLHTQDSVGHVWQFDHWGGNYDLTLVPSFETWVHIVHVYDGQNVKIYANGAKVADYAAALNTAAGGQDLAVGYWADFNPGYQHGVFRGLIDEFKVYNYALSAKEVGTLYLEGAGEGPICVETPQYDFTGDCRVTLEDFAILAADWLESTLVTP